MELMVGYFSFILLWRFSSMAQISSLHSALNRRALHTSRTYIFLCISRFMTANCDFFFVSDIKIWEVF